jgi:hypothetical protein
MNASLAYRLSYKATDAKVTVPFPYYVVASGYSNITATSIAPTSKQAVVGEL